MSAKRASGASQAFGRLSTPKQPEVEQVASTPKKPAPAVKEERTSKYTVLLSDNDALLWDQLAMTLRRDLGRKVDKSAMVRALVYLAAEDDDLRHQLADTLTRDGVTA